jgi:hypothetical protein
MSRADEVTVRSSLEEFLKHEGLLSLIPPYRQERMFRLRTGLPWMCLMLLSSSGLLALGGTSGAALLAPVGVLLLDAAFIAVLSVLYATRMRSNPIPAAVDVYLTALAPVSLAVYIGWTAQSFWALAGSGIVFHVLFDMLMSMQDHGARLYMVWSQLKLGMRMIVRSAKMATILLPLLLVFVLFSLFSQEIWIVLSMLEADQAAGAFVLLVLPASFYIWASVKIRVRELVGAMDKEKMRAELMKIPVIRANYHEGYLSPEELNEAHRQVAWRDMESLNREIIPVIRHRLKVQLYLLAGGMGVVLSVCFAVYFFALFYTLIPDVTAAVWTGKSHVLTVYTLRIQDYLPLPGVDWVIEIKQVHMAEAKVAAALGVLLAILANVYALAEETVQKSLEVWLTPHIQQWQTAGFYYRSLLIHNLHIVGEPLLRPDRSFSRVTAQSPDSLPDEKVEAACRTLRHELREFTRVEIRVWRTPPSDSGDPVGGADEAWIMIDDRSSGEYRFSPVPARTSPIRTQHFLGHQLAGEQQAIPDEWFGDTPDTAALAKAVWEADRARQQPVILHPYVTRTDHEVSIEVRLMKRLSRRRDYDQLLDSIARCGALPDIEELDVSLIFREDHDSICSMLWNRPLGFRQYTDEYGSVRFSHDVPLASFIRSNFVKVFSRN